MEYRHAKVYCGQLLFFLVTAQRIGTQAGKPQEQQETGHFEAVKKSHPLNCEHSTAEFVGILGNFVVVLAEYVTCVHMYRRLVCGAA